ncbi:AAL021Wp [Eremothecium gossypii ATCC 10895]|uniref:AAL021Wp n=1 Tax=Eremothecium gossypii (strain ATCC 10895 / CBS 109.51 / FGSC 9923 / NRRL Y-1056) TaxID=284811 RepID=Q75ET7_EREGS|nr:AAL021Wp [Eremothecium gossypii ATCC 10895]AAS50345.1 AAL021Wp [Eremothecium gossypii ATCC 10895]AEY94631.1 FAAL021Wp [Eremothecium gossypii FDAG1]
MLRQSIKGIGSGSWIRCNSSSSTAALVYKQLHKHKVKPPVPKFETSSWSANSAVASILYETPAPSREPKKQCVLNCLVQNEPGVLSRVSGTLAAKGFNIDSLVVCSTEVPDLSRMTIVLQGQDAVVEQARRQIEDLVPVYAVLDYTNTDLIKRELLLTRISLLGAEYFEELVARHAGLTEACSDAAENVSADQTFHPSNLPLSELQRMKHEHLNAITNLATNFGGRVVDISESNCVVELSAKPSRISAFLKLIKPYGVLEVARTGMMALPRTPVDDETTNQENMVADASEAVDISQLPPG